MIKEIKENETVYTPSPIARKQPWLNILLIIVGVSLFLFSIDLMGSSFNRMGTGIAESIILATENPFIGLFIGLLITALIQSSSTSTAMIVAVVASGALSFDNAVPMIMGANIGTTLTSTIVSLGYITKRKEFRKAISAGTIHDFFNIIITVILFPLEYYYGFVSYLAITVKGIITPDGFSNLNPGRSLFEIIHPLSKLILNEVQIPLVVLIISFILLFLSIKLISTLIYQIFIGKFKDVFKEYVFRNTYKAFSFGVLLTAGVQSSSITTSLIVPLVATGKISLKRSFPFIMGANIGTTITALLAAMFRSEAAMNIALAHLIFNLMGVLLFLPFPLLRKFPVFLASRFGKITMRYRLIGFAYIIITFFILPFTLIYFNKEEKPEKDGKLYRFESFYKEGNES
jgi:sodium-dependent phosphate cotransporter